MDKIKIYAYKHDGSFHRAWTKSSVLKENKDYYVSYTKKGTKVVESEKHMWHTKEDAVCYFSKKRWFNIIIMFKEKEIVYYCNLATPVLKELDSFKYIDYDLDLKYFVATKKIFILDKKEFIVNKEFYGYPEWVEIRVQRELKILQTWAKDEIGPFSEEFRTHWHNVIKGEIDE